MSSGATVVDMTLSDEARALGTEARQRKAVERAADLALIMSELRTSGVTSLSGIALALTGAAFPRHVTVLLDRGPGWTRASSIALNFGRRAIRVRPTRQS